MSDFDITTELASVIQHRDIPKAHVHAAYSWIVDNKPQRDALESSLTTQDVYKILFQRDNRETYVYLGQTDGFFPIGGTVIYNVVEAVSSLEQNITNIENFIENTEVFTSQEKTKLGTIESGAQVNAPTNLGVVNGTTSGPTITSSTGSNVALPIASASASGVVTTGAQTLAGTKTFNNRPTTNDTSLLKGFKNTTISTNDPSGGSDGDVWFKY